MSRTEIPVLKNIQACVRAGEQYRLRAVNGSRLSRLLNEEMEARNELPSQLRNKTSRNYDNAT